jgi:hypothetical protein
MTLGHKNTSQNEQEQIDLTKNGILVKLNMGQGVYFYFYFIKNTTISCTTFGFVTNLISP